MKKFILNLFLLIFSQQIFCQTLQKLISRIEININDKHIKKLNEIESIILNTANQYKKNEIPEDQLEFYSYVGTSILLKQSELELEDEKLMTNKYELILIWDSTNTNAMIYGFSRKYIVKQKKYIHHSNSTKDEILNRILFLIPYYQYSSILSVEDYNFVNEIIKEYIKGIVSKQSLINYIYKGEIQEFTIRKIPIEKYDNLPPYKLSYLNNDLIEKTVKGPLLTYKTPNSKEPMTRLEFTKSLERHIVTEYYIDTVSSDEATNIAIYDKWTFVKTNMKDEIDLFDFSKYLYLKKLNQEIIYFYVKPEFIGLDLPPNETSKEVDRLIWYNVSNIKNSKVLRINNYLELFKIDFLNIFNANSYNEALSKWNWD